MIKQRPTSIVLIFSLLMTFMSTSLFAKDATSELDFTVKFASLVLKTGEKINRDLGTAHFSELEDAKIEEIIRTRIDDYLVFIKDETNLSSAQFQFIKRYFAKIKGKNLVEIIKSTQFGLEVFLKKHGVGIAIAMGVGQIVNYVLVYVSYLMAMPQMIPIVQLFPFSWAFAVTPAIYQKIKVKRKIIEILGGREQYRAYNLQIKMGLSKIKKSHNLILPLSTEFIQGEAYTSSLLIEKSDWMSKYFSHLGFNKRKLNFNNLKNFIKKEKIEDAYINKIITNGFMDKELKTILISTHILGSDKNKNILKFKAVFSNNFIKTQAITSWDKLEKWTLDLLAHSDRLTIRESMFNIPADTPPEVIFEIWEHILMPHLATMRDVKYKAFRKFKEEMQALKAWSYQQNTPQWNLAHVERFDSLLASSFRLFPLACQHPEAHALKFLLNHSN